MSAAPAPERFALNSLVWALPGPPRRSYTIDKSFPDNFRLFWFIRFTSHHLTWRKSRKGTRWVYAVYIMSSDRYLDILQRPLGRREFRKSELSAPPRPSAPDHLSSRIECSFSQNWETSAPPRPKRSPPGRRPASCQTVLSASFCVHYSLALLHERWGVCWKSKMKYFFMTSSL